MKPFIMKPCPFCGSELYATYAMSYIDETVPYRFVHPAHETCPISKLHIHPSRIDAWDIRIENND